MPVDAPWRWVPVPSSEFEELCQSNSTQLLQRPNWRPFVPAMPRPVAVWGWPNPPSARTIAASGVVLGGVQATLDVFTAAPSGSTYGWKGYRYVYVKREDGTVVRGGSIKSLGNTDHHAGWVPPWPMRPSGGT